MALTVFAAAGPSSAAQFEEVTDLAGMAHAGHSFGAAWGDLDGDGWPDLWVGNHYSPPSLYLNQRDGRFIDVAPELGLAVKADAHGAAWADFDNDGDQDLLELTGASSGTGSGPNHFYVNDEGNLRERAVEFGLDYPLGRGRTPLWFDADGDGRLDVLIVNMPRPDEQAPSAVFRQTPDGFEPVETAILERSLTEKVQQKVAGALGTSAPDWLSPPNAIQPTDHHAQIAALVEPGRTDLVMFSSGHRLGVYSLGELPLHDVSERLNFPDQPIEGVQDVAIEDFDGDGRADLFFARVEDSHTRSAVVQETPSSLKGYLGNQGEQQKTVCFRSAGELRVQLHPEWQADPSRIFLGGSRANPKDRFMTLSPEDPRVWREGPPPLAEDEIGIDFEPSTEQWCLSSRASKLNFVVEAEAPVREITTPDFEPSQGAASGMLLLRRGDAFELSELVAEDGEPRACQSVAAGDFDNDMDVDLYLVCSGPVGNLPNILYQNDGKGGFTPVPAAGGAAGSERGRGETVVSADYDRDGFLDLFVTNGEGPSPFADDGPHQLFRNRGNDHHWLQIDLVGTASNRDGIGALVFVETAGITQRRQQRGGIHLHAQHHQRLHFGLGDHRKVDTLTVHWPSGRVQTLRDVTADQILRIEEAGPPAPR